MPIASFPPTLFASLPPVSTIPTIPAIITHLAMLTRVGDRARRAPRPKSTAPMRAVVVTPASTIWTISIGFAGAFPRTEQCTRQRRYPADSSALGIGLVDTDNLINLLRSELLTEGYRGAEEHLISILTAGRIDDF